MSPECPKNRRTRPDRGETKSPLVKHRGSSQVNQITLTDRTPIAPKEGVLGKLRTAVSHKDFSTHCPTSSIGWLPKKAKKSSQVT